MQHAALGKVSSINSYAPFEDCASFFAGLNIDAAMIMRDYRVEEFEHAVFRGVDLDETFRLQSIEEAKRRFDYGHHSLIASNFWANQQSRGKHVTVVADQPAYILRLTTRFVASLDELMSTKGMVLTVRDSISVAVLRLHVLYARVSSMYANSPTPKCESDDSTVVSLMREMVEWGEKIVSFLLSITTQVARSYCLGMGYIIPLFTVASKCPDRSLRRASIRLLSSISRQEGLWNSIVVARAAERITEIEESHGVFLSGVIDEDIVESRPIDGPSVLQIDGIGY
ncbi:unnamed protein product [Clonostachys solani]|uniref:Uncharacterized protein n=1 Tax=Clonostachys solani TaxID=160281 RepID=A0A9N9ZKJ0_9HYPO|nr:unnamed protein product [Clonostachys solani]